MTTKDVTNNSKGALGLPGGPVIRPGATVRVKDWEKKESSVVKSWIEAKALTVKDVEGGEPEPAPPPADNGGAGDNAGNGEGQGGEGGEGGQTAFVPKTDEELEAMNNGERAAYIENELGGDVKSGSTKDVLIAQIKELEAAKAAAANE